MKFGILHEIRKRLNSNCKGISKWPCLRSHPVREDSLRPYMGWQTSDDVYVDWPENDPFKYYWQAWDLEITEREGYLNGAATGIPNTTAIRRFKSFL